MDFSVVEHRISNYVIYYIDAEPICDADGVAITSPLKAAHSPITLTSVYPNPTFNKASKVIIRLISDKFTNGVLSSKVIYIFTACLTLNSETDFTSETITPYTLINPTSMVLHEDLNITSVNVFAVIDDVETPVHDYHIQLCSTEQPLIQKTTSKKILTKIQRKV
ncbi:Hypothetical protein FSTVST1_222 [Faustovirus ST1]|nr:Hypothetical protein FSTVST1_222 [Faustovirus ST1]